MQFADQPMTSNLNSLLLGNLRENIIYNCNIPKDKQPHKWRILFDEPKTIDGFFFAPYVTSGSWYCPGCYYGLYLLTEGGNMTFEDIPGTEV